MSDLDRFVVAQDPVLRVVREELRQGAKRTHWMWFVFPQLRGLGHSPTARHYALSSLAEASSYLRHPVLGPRLLDCTALVLAVPGRTTSEIFGSPDDLKFHSSMTLFNEAASGSPTSPNPFAAALARFHDGRPDPRTLDLLRTA